jgi:hypothetical protein
MSVGQHTFRLEVRSSFFSSQIYYNPQPEAPAVSVAEDIGGT